MPVSSSHHDSFDVQVATQILIAGNSYRLIQFYVIKKALEESLKDVQQNFDVDTVEALQLNEVSIY